MAYKSYTLLQGLEAAPQRRNSIISAEKGANTAKRTKTLSSLMSGQFDGFRAFCIQNWRKRNGGGRTVLKLQKFLRYSQVSLPRDK